MMRGKEKDNKLFGKRGFIFCERDKEEKLQKEVFSAELTIAFVLVTVLSVSCSFGGWSV